MAYELDDNTRGALDFALIAAGILLGLRLSLFLLDLLNASMLPWEAEGALHGLQMDYLLFKRNMVVADGDPRSVRFAAAVTYALIGGGLAAGLSALIAMVRGAGARRSAIRVGRATFLAVLAWCITAALFLPCTAMEAKNDALLLHTRAHLPGSIALPWPSRTTPLGPDADGPVLSAWDPEHPPTLLHLPVGAGPEPRTIAFASCSDSTAHGALDHWLRTSGTLP